MIQVVAATGVIMLGVNPHAVEYFLRVAEIARERLRPLQLDDRPQATPSPVVQAAHIQHTDQHLGLVRKHVVVVGPARAHVEPRLHIALIRDQNVLKRSIKKAVEFFIGDLDAHALGRRVLPVIESRVHPGVEPDVFHSCLLIQVHDGTERNLDVQSCKAPGRQRNFPQHGRSGMGRGYGFLSSPTPESRHMVLESM